MPLVKVDPPIVGTTVLDYDPMLEVYRDVLYVPAGVAGWPCGIYDRGRKLIAAATHFRGGADVAPIFSPYTITNDITSAPRADQKEPFFFLGHIPTHYGHFLTIALARLWPMRFERDHQIKFITTDNIIRDFGSFPYMREIFYQLGIGQHEIMNFDRPVWINELIVPSPCFEENNFGHSVFYRLCKRIGWSLTNNIPKKQNDRPVYFSKHRLSQGVSHIINEVHFCEILEKHGFDIIFPEDLTFIEQVLLVQEREVLTGSVGSAFHTTLFAEQPKKIVGMTHVNTYTENQVIIDKLVGNNVSYLYPMHDIEPVKIEENKYKESFHLSFKLINPKKTAYEFINIVELNVY